MNEKPHYIYGLVEPGSDTIRYIGCTSDPYRRLCQHVWVTGYAGLFLRQWLRALLQSNKEPQMVFLDKVNNKATALRIETDWILTLKAAGVPLTNRLYPGHEDWGRESRLARRKR